MLPIICHHHWILFFFNLSLIKVSLCMYFIIVMVLIVFLFFFLFVSSSGIHDISWIDFVIILLSFKNHSTSSFYLNTVLASRLILFFATYKISDCQWLRAKELGCTKNCPFPLVNFFKTTVTCLQVLAIHRIIFTSTITDWTRKTMWHKWDKITDLRESI